MNNTIIRTIGATTVTDLGVDDAYRIDCGICGEQVTYRFRNFTVTEALRHETWCADHKGGRS